jgi:hypothetical protein
MQYPVERNLDGIYYRVKREDKYFSLCFSDLTDEEQTEFLSRLEKDGFTRMCKELAASLRRVGDQFDIFSVDE